MLSKFDIPQLESLLNDYYNLTQIRTVIFDDTFKEIASYPREKCEFCRIIRSDKRANELCNQSDINACEMCRKTGKPYIYRCHAGLTETVTPVKLDNIIIGYMMFGQILMTDSKNDDCREMMEKCEGYNLDMKKLEEAYHSNRFIGISQVISAAKILEACASYLWLSKLVVLAEEGLSERLENYIIKNIEEPLKVDEICRDLKISKSCLYKLSEHNYGMSIGKYIREKRISIAKGLLIKEGSVISEVANSVGIKDYNYFTKVFKKVTEYTPSTYRKKYGLIW